MTTGRVRHI